MKIEFDVSGGVSTTGTVLLPDYPAIFYFARSEVGFLTTPVGV